MMQNIWVIDLGCTKNQEIIAWRLPAKESKRSCKSENQKILEHMPEVQNLPVLPEVQNFKPEQYTEFKQSVFSALFYKMGMEFFSKGEWEVRFEAHPQAYIHINRPNWGDENMNGIHFEAYILGKELEEKQCYVAIHCEVGCPFQIEFHEIMKTHGLEKKIPEYAKLRFCEGSVVCEARMEFGVTPVETMEIVVNELEKLMAFSDLIDEVIEECQKE
jgi:hypothetical protein